MKRMIGLLVVLTVAGVCLPAMAQENDQSIFVVRSRDVGDAPDDLLLLCAEKKSEVPTPGVVLDPIPLNAEFWSLNTRAKDGLVKNEFVKQVGTAAGCGYPVVTADGLVLALYADSDVAGVTFEGWGECDLPVLDLPALGSLTGGCQLIAGPQPEQGIADIVMTSNSVLGEATGSFWTIRVIWE